MSKLVVAAHGQGEGSETNRLVALLAERAAGLAGFADWGLAFHRGRPGFGDDLAPDSVVVPLLTSDGYYLCKLRRSLAQARVTAPVGTSPWLPDLVARRVGEICRTYSLALPQTSLLLVGHGTRRNGLSRRSTEELAEALRDGPVREVRTAFLDEEPGPEQVECLGRNRIVVPFLIGPGDHALQDLPRRLGTPLGWHERTFLDQPLGQNLSLAELIAERASGRIPAFARQEGQNPWSIS